MLIPFNSQQSIGLLVLRIAIGIIFLVHGLSKIKSPKATIKHMGPGFGHFMVFIGLAETLGGIAEIVGFLTQYASLGLALVMLGAMFMKIFKWHAPFTSHEKLGWEFDLVLFGLAIGLLCLGAGQYSFDFWQNWWP